MTVTLNIDQGIASITFNRPEAMNALDEQTSLAFAEKVSAALDDGTVRVICLKAHGRAFAAGGDLAAFHQSEDRAALAGRIIPPFNEALLRLANAPQPVIAVIQGVAAGAGMSIALMADLAIASDKASFTLAYPKVGVPPDCGGSWALVRLLGLRKAMEIALLSPQLSAQEALALGLVNRVVPAEELEDAAADWAKRLAQAAPLAQAHTKRLIRAAQTAALSDQLEAEKVAFMDCAKTADFTEALDAFFTRRAPHFIGQ